MPRIICKLPNASTTINGVSFAPAPAGMLSDEISAEAAELFLAIPGYELVRPQGKTAEQLAAEAAAAEAAAAEAAAKTAAKKGAAK